MLGDNVSVREGRKGEVAVDDAKKKGGRKLGGKRT